MSFIDSTYFVDKIEIPNTSAAPVLTKLPAAITKYEKKILISLLGYKLYSLLIIDQAKDVADQEQKYTDLVNGAEFGHVYEGETITLKWEGLKNTAKVSLIAYYTYYMYVDNDITHLTGTGMSMAPAGKDWVRVSSVNKLCSVWDDMRELYGKIPPQYKKYYDKPLKGDNLPGTFNCDPSAYNFLYANKDDYPDWIFRPLWNQNAFGI